MSALTLTVIANMTANYGEGLGNISSVQKVYSHNKVYASKSSESLKNAICVQSGLYDDLQTQSSNASKKADKESDDSKEKGKKNAVQKRVDSEVNAATNRALEGGYLSTGDLTYKRNSSFYVTDAVAVDPFINEAQFHNNLYLAENNAKANNRNLQESAKDSGLMPYQYEYDKGLKIYSLTIDLDRVGIDENFAQEADADEKIARVNALLDAVENLSLVVKGSLDNAEPIFVVGGISKRKTHVFENSVRVRSLNLNINALKEKMNDNFSCAMMRNGQFANEDDIVKELSPKRVGEFFSDLKEQVKAYYSK